MTTDPETIAKLSDSLIDEIVGAVGLPKTKFTHRIGWTLFNKITTSFAHIGAPFNETTGADGLPEASRVCLTHFCDRVKVQGIENIPASGPLLIVTNHPGAYDGLTIFSNLARKDIKWISTEIPFLRLLPKLSEHILFASREDSRNRMVVLRNAINHLKSGGVLVYFAAGHRDPDPAVFHGASRAIDGWLDIFDMFFKYIPELQVLPVIISGCVSSHWANHLLTRLRRKQIDKQRLAEFGQVISQLMHPGRIYLTPAVSFGKPLTKEMLEEEAGKNTILNVVIQHEKVLLKQHCENFGGHFD